MTWQRWKGIMKCYPFEETRLAKWKPPYIIQPKYDGDRCRNDEGLLLSSEENVFFSVPHINEQINDLGLSSVPLDGELYNHNLFLEGGHELIHSIVSRTVNRHPRYQEMDFIIFDLQYKDQFQIERLNLLSRIEDYKNIKIAPYWICETLDEIKRVYDKLIAQNYEGIIVRHLYNAYEEKRSTMMMKFKPKKKDTYKIVGWKEEVSKDGIPKRRIGSLIMSSQEGDEFGVSAGLDDEEKANLWIGRNQLIGKEAIVHYQHLTMQKIPKGTFDVEVLM